MKKILSAVLLGTLVTLSGCNKDTSGGPGATTPPSTKSVIGQTENTFSLDAPSQKIMQGESKKLSIVISRGKNFDEEVSLMFEGLPKGLSLEPATHTIKHGDTDAKLTLKATGDAALGDFIVKVMGHPTKGAVANSELKINVAKLEVVAAPNTTVENVREKRDEYVLAMQNMFDELEVKYAALKESAAQAEGDAKINLDNKIAQVDEKRSAAALKLDELKAAGDDRWEKIKDAVGNAFDELKTMFD